MRPGRTGPTRQILASATRRRIVGPEGDVISGPERIVGPGGVTCDLRQSDFLDGPAPDAANPSLWRRSRLNAVAGLSEVTPGIRQIRGFDPADMSLVRGDTGWILIDPLTANGTAAAGAPGAVVAGPVTVSSEHHALRSNPGRSNR